MVAIIPTFQLQTLAAEGVAPSFFSEQSPFPPCLPPPLPPPSHGVCGVWGGHLRQKGFSCGGSRGANPAASRMGRSGEGGRTRDPPPAAEGAPRRGLGAGAACAQQCCRAIRVLWPICSAGSRRGEPGPRPHRDPMPVGGRGGGPRGVCAMLHPFLLCKPALLIAFGTLRTESQIP